MNIVREIKSILAFQARSLKKELPYIGKDFANAVQLIHKCHGKLIVTGVGKSGLIAQKLASTLVSTGTSAAYLHPIEGMHGNLGMVNKNDIVLAIGKSGESEEILNILPSIKKIGAKLICMTSNQNSSLAKASSLVLYLPVDREACPLNMAPTTSSAVFLVVGDAMAVTLMKMKGFGLEHFALFHPGGLLGKKLLFRVSDVMRKGNQNPVVRLDASIQKLLEVISRKWTGAASIVDKKGKFKGLVTDYDIRKMIMKRKAIMDLDIPAIMNAKATFIYADQMAAEAAKLMEMRKKPFTVLPVLDRKKRAIGMIHVHDLIQHGLLQQPSSRK